MKELDVLGEYFRSFLLVCLESDNDTTEQVQDITNEIHNFYGSDVPQELVELLEELA